MAIADSITQLSGKKRIVYSDITVNMDVHPDTGDLFLITNENAIKQSLKNLVKTQTYERLYDPAFGGNLTKSLFQLMTTEELYTIKTMLENSIKNQEQRVTLTNINLVADFEADGVNITIQYTINNIPGPQVVSLFVARIR
jgi:phage baseplate assembly protein W